MIALLIITAFAGLSPDAQQPFTEANAAFERGDYQQALSLYKQLKDAHGIKSPALFYNMGNALFALGSLGVAIQHYEAALQLDPRFEPAQGNLAKALSATRRNLPQPDTRSVDQRLLIRYCPLSPMQCLLLAHGSLIAVLIGLFAYQWRPLTRFLWGVCISACLACFFFVLTLGVNATVDSKPKLAVTLTPEAPVYFSMHETEQPRFLLYEGDRVLVDRIEGDWMRVNAHGGERGWTLKEHVALVQYAFL